VKHEPKRSDHRHRIRQRLTRVAEDVLASLDGPLIARAGVGTNLQARKKGCATGGWNRRARIVDEHVGWLIVGGRQP